jgi:hypothetical protein
MRPDETANYVVINFRFFSDPHHRTGRCECTLLQIEWINDWRNNAYLTMSAVLSGFGAHVS